MKRTIGVFVSVVLFACLAVDGRLLTGAVAAAEGPHDYFNALVKRADHWKSYSLRSQEQMLEYRHSGGRDLGVTYDPANDSYPKRQDAAKVTIPEFSPKQWAELAKPLGLADTQVVLTATNAQMSSTLTHNRALKIGDEIVRVVRESGVGITDNTVRVLRGQHGTAAKSHAAATSVRFSATYLLNQLRVPVGTEDGHTYLFTWDTWWGREFDYDNTGIGNYKTFQFGAPLYWFQIQTDFRDAPGSDIGAVGGLASPGNQSRSEAFGPNVESNYPLKPQIGSFNVRPDTWTRYWLLVEQRAGGWDPTTMWVADENRDAVKIFDAIQLNVPDSISMFSLEFNTSANELQAGRGTLVAYVRNWVALRDARNTSELLQRPGAGIPLPPPPDGKPGAPRNLRIIPR